MRLLWIGSMHEAIALARALLRADQHQITRCDDGASAGDELRRHGAEYDWVIAQKGTLSDAIHGIETVPGGRDACLADALRGPGGSGESQAPAVTLERLPCACGVERDHRGVMQLHCALRALRNPAGTTESSRGPRAIPDSFCFEYSAPRRRRSQT